MPFSIPLTRRRVLVDALAGIGALCLSSSAGDAASACANTATGPDPVRDFDFFIGTWLVSHSRLKERLAGSSEWQKFDGTCHVRSLLGGCANIDDSLVDLPDGAYRGIGLRAFDAKTKTWADWWLDGRDPHKIDVPVVGRFANGVGTFLSDDTLRGKPIKVRGLWSRITPTSLQWDQAFSPDGGKTWETNWIMRYARMA